MLPLLAAGSRRACPVQGLITALLLLQLGTFLAKRLGSASGGS